MISSETWPITELVKDPRNAMLHPDDNMAAIRASLTEYGQVEPLLVQKATRLVIAGNGRLQAMRELGFEQAWVTVIDVDDVRAKALGLVMNQAGRLARWDAARVLELIGELEAEVPHLAGVASFSEAELHKLTNIAAKEEREALEAISAATASPPSKQKDTEPKRIMCADCPFRHG